MGPINCAPNPIIIFSYRARLVLRDFGPSIYLNYWHRSVLVITPRSANFEVWRINNKLFVVFGRNERAFISSVVWVVTALVYVFFNRHSTTMNPMEEKERRPILTMQASRDNHSNSSNILLNTTCISPSAGPTGSPLGVGWGVL